MYLTSSVLESIQKVRHGFGTQDEPIPSFVHETWDRLRPKWKQTHGTQLAFVKEVGQECGEVDALRTQTQNLPIAVVTADCVPILMAHQSGRQVCAIHAGWRGSYARIVEKVWNELQAQGEAAKEWVAAIGPAIGPCCYEVSEGLIQDFTSQFTEFEPSQISPSFRKLDLPRVNEMVLEKLGIGKVEILRVCTLCSTEPRFNSFRRDAGTKRQWSVIVRS